MKPLFSPAWIGSVLTTIVLTTPGVHAQGNDIAAARDLYASAAYDDALTLLNRLRASDHPANQSRVIDQYRAFCLLALGRPADAEQAIEAVVAAEPSYHPSDSDVSPRVRSAFAEVRRRMLPAIVQQKYTQAKAAFDRKEFAIAAEAFSQVLVTLADPDLSADAMRPPLSDMRTLAVGFEELSAKAAPPLPPPPPVVAAVPAAPLTPAAVPRRIYIAEDRTVVPPFAVRQSLPQFRGPIGVTRTGRLEIVIDESGSVESAVMTESISSGYDRIAVAAAKTWQFKPASVNGVAVRFRKVIQVSVKASS
jgi:TonB family protein